MSGRGGGEERERKKRHKKDTASGKLLYAGSEGEDDKIDQYRQSSHDLHTKCITTPLFFAFHLSASSQGVSQGIAVDYALILKLMLAISPSLEKSGSECARLRCDKMHIWY